MSYITCEKGRIEFGKNHPLLLINENVRIYEPNGINQQMYDALKCNDIRPLVDKACKGLELLDYAVTDICIDAPGLDEETLLPEVALAIHETTGTALSLDSRNINALRHTLEVYPYKPIINSVPYENEHMQAMLPLVAQYDAAVVLILTELAGMPTTVDERLRIAEKLVKAAQGHGIPLENIIIDPMVFAAYTTPEFMPVYLDSVVAIRREFDCSVLLAGSNVGFGMPAPGMIDQAFMMAAIAAGVDLILVPYEAPVIPAVFATIKAMDFLSGRDPGGLSYIRSYRKNSSRFAL